jgi:hypothetical protein
MDNYIFQIVVGVIAILIGLFEYLNRKDTAAASLISNIKIAIDNARAKATSLGLSGTEQKALATTIAKDLFKIDLTTPRNDAIRRSLVYALDQIQNAA